MGFQTTKEKTTHAMFKTVFAFSLSWHTRTCARISSEPPAGKAASGERICAQVGSSFARPVRNASLKPAGSELPAAERSFFGDFSLCLSRACLGKVFGFIYKWLKKGVFRTCGGGGGEVSYDRSQHYRGVSPAGGRKRHRFFKLGVCFPCVC
eukprot:COSAG06_NODE_10885_length_1601_cov_168.692941_1_plen_151_part_10